MNINPRQLLNELDADSEELAPTPRRAEVGMTAKIQKIRTNEGKAIKAENSQYRGQEGKRKYHKK